MEPTGVPQPPNLEQVVVSISNSVGAHVSQRFPGRAGVKLTPRSRGRCRDPRGLPTVRHPSAISTNEGARLWMACETAHVARTISPDPYTRIRSSFDHQDGPEVPRNHGCQPEYPIEPCANEFHIHRTL